MEKIEKRNEIYLGHKPVPLDIAFKVTKSICKITIKINANVKNGTGFFMKISNNLLYLITNYHIINPNIINEDIEIEIWNHKKIYFDLNDHINNIKFFEQPKDITIIQVNNRDEIYNDIEFLDFDRNYINGYNIYKNADVFTIQYPFGQNASCASGSIKDIYDYEFEHNISTNNGSSGSPIILLNNNINNIQVIGIHKCGFLSKPINGGTFIGEIFKEMNIDNISDEIKRNYIISEIDIKEENINRDIRIINSFEEFMKEKDSVNMAEEKIYRFSRFCQEKNIESRSLSKEEAEMYFLSNEDLKNEEEIKSCEIRINDKLIQFNYFHIFNKKGKYKIEYRFKNKLTKTSDMFHGCLTLTNIDLSNFDSQSVTNMEYMFADCEALENLNLSNFDTKNVKSMSGMFVCCKSLKYINLSNFNTQNVTNMEMMFGGCESLNYVDLSNFNTQNVTNMAFMFFGCKSLKTIKLYNFNAQNVTNMESMFDECVSLTNINLSDFKTKNIVNMSNMFKNCKSLKTIDLSNFKTYHANNMAEMFKGCESLKNINLSNFYTKNVLNMSGMFSYCKSLENIDLSSFNIQNVTNMDFMFFFCKSLKKIDLSNFSSQNETRMYSMFKGCDLLKKGKIISKDKRIIQESKKN